MEKELLEASSSIHSIYNCALAYALFLPFSNQYTIWEQNKNEFKPKNHILKFNPCAPKGVRFFLFTPICVYALLCPMRVKYMWDLDADGHQGALKYDCK